METIDAVKDEPVIDKIAQKMDALADAIPDEARSVLGGDWLGHPLHPALTDLPIGFFTSSFVLDLLGGRRTRRASAAFVGLGLASAVPTIASGLVEFKKIEGKVKRDTAAVHFVANGIGTLLYALSFSARLKGKRGRGVLFGLVAAAALTVGGYLGGELAFGSSAADAADDSAADDSAARTAATNAVGVGIAD